MNRLVANEKNQVQVIARAATILRALEDENGGLSLGQIAQRVNLARSTVQRIVAALECEKLVIAATPNGRVRLGPAILRLAASVRSDFTALARPFLEQLSEELHETVDLSTVKKDHLVFIDQVAIEKLIGREYEARTPKSLVTLETLLKDLAAARRTGVAFDREEHTLGICAAGVSLRDPLGNAVAISVPVPSLRFEELETAIAERLIATKRAMETHMNSAAA